MGSRPCRVRTSMYEGLPADFQCAGGSTQTCLGSILISWTSPIWQQLRE